MHTGNNKPPFRRPRKFDCNLIVIGAGSGGLVASYIAAAVKAKVTLIEKHKMGGDCLNTGCVPSKALIRSARFIAQSRRAQEFGFDSARLEFDFSRIMQRVQSVIAKIEPHDSIERYTKLGVEIIEGQARLSSPYAVEVNGQTLTARTIIIATGARPTIPAIPGLDKLEYLTSDSVWKLRELPKRLLVLGGGPIGCELAQSFARFGVESDSKVIMVQRGSRLMSREDEEVSAYVARQFKDEGIDLRLTHRPKCFKQEGNRKILVAEHAGKEVEIEFDQLLVALGRSANISGFGLEELGVKISARNTIEVNTFLQTNYPNIYACGDVAGPYQFTHVAAHQAWYASVNALFSPFKKFRVDYSVIPFATFTDPEVARVGLNEQQAKAQGMAYEVTSYELDDLDRAITDSEAHGFIKVLTVPGKDKILGATIVGEHAAELIAEFVSAMRHNLGLNKILSTIHIYPTWSEANKYVAGNWKKSHVPVRLLHWVARFHAWRRS